MLKWNGNTKAFGILVDDVACRFHTAPYRNLAIEECTQDTELFCMAITKVNRSNKQE